MRRWFWVAVFGCAAEPEVVAPAAGEVVADPLQSEVFRWCHEAQRDVHDLVAWCALLDDLPPETCPGMRETCAAPDLDWRPPVGCDADGSWRGGGIAGAPARPELEFERMPVDCGEPPRLGRRPWLRWLRALAVAALVVGVGWLIAGALGWSRPAPRRRVEQVGPAAEVGIEGDDDLPSLPEQELLALGWRALEEDRLGEAAVYARGAALRRLARIGLLRLHRARTDREYVAALRGEPERQAALVEVVGAVEAHRWALRPLSDAQARGALEAAARVLAVLALCCVLLPEARAGNERYGPDGDAAVVRLFAESGYEILPSTGVLVLDGVDVAVLNLAEVTPTEAQWSTIEQWVVDGGLLIVAGDGLERPWLHAALGERRPRASDGAVLSVAASVGAGALPMPVLPGGPESAYCAADGSAWVVPNPASAARAVETEPSWTAEEQAWGSKPSDEVHAQGWCVEAVVVRGSHGEGHVIGVADERLLTNAALLHPENRAMWVGLAPEGARLGWWELPDRPKVALMLWSGGSGPSAPPGWSTALIPLLVHLTALWLLVIAWRAWPSGSLRPASAAERQSFAQHVHALARQWAGAQGEGYAATAYARLWHQRLGARGLLAAARRAGLDEAASARLLAWVGRRVAEPEQGVDEEDLMRVEELWRATRRR